ARQSARRPAHLPSPCPEQALKGDVVLCNRTGQVITGLWFKIAGVSPRLFSGAPKHMHRGRNDLGRFPLIPIAVFPIAGPQPAFYVDLSSLGEILAANFCQLTKSHDTMPFGSFGLLPVLVGKISAGSHVKCGYRRSAAGIAHLGISTQASNQDNLVYSGHGLLLA